MSNGPSIRELRAIVESYNQEVEEAARLPNGDPVPDSLMVDIEDTEAWKNRNTARTDFEPTTNMCPDCEGTGQNRMKNDSAFPGLGHDCERCEGEGAVFEANSDSYVPQYENPDQWEGQEVRVTAGEYRGATGEVEDVLIYRAETGKKEAEFTVNLHDGKQITLYPSEFGHDQLELVRDEAEDNFMFDNPFESITEAASRKDFRMVADLISKIEDPALRQSSAKDHAKMFALQNPRFNRTLFMAAAGVDESGPELDHLRHPDDIEEETLTELDRDTYVSYMNKAALDGQNYAKQGVAAEMDDDPESADAHMGRFSKRTKGIGRAADTLLGPRFSDDKELDPHRGDLAMARSITKGYADEFSEDDKPYATMKDGPDKYLFRKDQKQKLVGSADNEPEDGEEELEETDMDKFIKEMQLAAGIITEVIEDDYCDKCDKELEKCGCDEPEYSSADSYKKMEAIEEDCDQDAEKNDDGECSPFTHADDNVDMVREDDLAKALGREDVPSPDLSNLEYETCPECGECGGHGEGCGELAKLYQEDEFGEDLLLAPKDAPGPEVDDMVYGKEGHGHSYDATDLGGEDNIQAFDRDMGDSIPFDSGDDYEDDPRSLGEGPGEFDHDDDAMVDVGDAEDYEKYDFDDEFEQMLGGSSDMPEAELVGMYEMNDLRRLAGMEQVTEEELDEIAPVVAAVARGAGAALAKGAMGAMSGDDVDEGAGGSDVVAYDIADEKAYYVMQDVLGAELDFGPEDEILVPLSRNDQVLVALDQQGLEKDVAFRVAGEQYEADLQNGYDDRKFSDGQDYFPKGATNQPATDLGPTAGDMGDNPMANKMRSVEKDDVYESMKLAYRRHRKA